MEVIIPIAVIILGGYLIYRYGQPKPALCPKCGGRLHADPYHYPNIVVWTCEECEDTFETLRAE